MTWSGLPERLENKIQPEPNSGCWLWIASCDTTGYGHVRWEGRLQQSHRVIYEYKHGKIVPEELVLDHFRCETRCCVNPDHVRPVTEQQNILRGVTTKAHQYAKRDCCAKGHLYTLENTKFVKGARICKLCYKAAISNWRKRNQKKCSAYTQKSREKHRAAYNAYFRKYRAKKKAELENGRT